VKTVVLADVSETIDYGVTASATALPVGPKFLRITDIQDGAVDWNSVPHCEADERKLTASRLRPGDIVFARTGATTGKSFLIRRCPDSAVFASYLIRVRPNSKVDPVFLSHFFNTPDYWRQITLKAAGAAQPGVNASKLQELTLPLPPLLEQRRIAAILDEADALRAKRRAALAQLDEMARAIFVEMFGDPTVASRWPVVKLSELLSDAAVFVDGDWIESKDQDPDGDVRLVQLADILDGEYAQKSARFLTSETAERLRCTFLQRGDILVARMPDPLGRACIFPGSTMPAVTAVDVCIIRPSASGPCAAWLMAAINSAPFRQAIERQASGTTRSRISRGNLGRLPMISPPLELQTAFAVRLAEVGRIKEEMSRSVAQLDSFFASLQHRAFRGEL
jgi:type I restriction enzyme S subunit